MVKKSVNPSSLPVIGEMNALNMSASHSDLEVNSKINSIADSDSKASKDAKDKDAKASTSKKKKKKKRLKSRGGIKSRPIKSIKHTLDFNMPLACLLGLVFTALTLATGPPIVLLAVALLPVALVLKRVFACQFRRLSKSTKATTCLERHWLYPSGTARNNNKHGTATALLYLDAGLTLDQLRDVIMARIISKDKYLRFRSLLVCKGLSRAPFWRRLAKEKFSIEDQVFEDVTNLRSKSQLKEHLLEVSRLPLSKKRPLWQMRWCYASYINQVVLIFRCHQSLCDGIGLLSTLVEQLADQAPPPQTKFVRTPVGGLVPSISAFKPHFGGINFAINVCRATVLGPLNCFMWFIWAFSRRKNNFLTSFHFYRKPRRGTSRANSVSQSSCSVLSKTMSPAHDVLVAPDPRKSIYWTSVDLAKVMRIKQVTRSSLNDVILAALSGAIREYIVNKSGIENPPALNISIPVDLRGVNDGDASSVGVHYVLLTTPLPTDVEGAIPRLWGVRSLTEELKASADPAVMMGTHYFLSNLLPQSLARFLVDFLHRNSSVCVSNLQGPMTELTIGTHRLRKIAYWMSAPPNIPVTVNLVTYNQRLSLSIATTSQLIPCAKSLAKLFKTQMDQYADLLARRRVPGEARNKKRAHHVIIEAPIGGGHGYGTSLSNLQPLSTIELNERLRQVQYDLNQLTDALNRGEHDREVIVERLEEYKEEFSELMRQIRRRKSIADHPNIIISMENDEDDDLDDDIDGEIRPAGRRFSMASRRGSVVSAINLGKRFSVTPPMLSRSHASSNSPEPSSSPDRCYREESLV